MPKDKTNHFVEERLVKLKSIKDKYDLTEKGKVWRNKINMIEENEPVDENDFRTQVSVTVKRQKDSELSANMPEFSFIPLSDDAQVNRRIVRETFNHHWLINNFDKVVSKTVKSATGYGTGITYVGIKHSIRKIKEPYIKEVELEGTKVKTMDYKERLIQSSNLEGKKIPFLNFFINGTDIDNSTEAIVVDYIPKDEYIARIEYNPMYKNIEQVRKSSKDYTYSSEMDGADIQEEWNAENVVTEISYYNIAKDEYIVVANGIEVVNSPIPFAHKELPFAIYYDNEAEDRFWGIWELELLADDEKAKNEYRSKTIEAVKASIGFILAERWADIEFQDVKFGIGEYWETDDIDGIQHFAPNTPVWAIAELERKVDDDIIAKSGVDFRSQMLTPNESATKTANKQASSRKRINLNIRDNWFGYFRRLGMLMLSNIQQLHEMQPRRIPIEGGSIRNDGVFVADDKNSYGSGIIGSNFTKGDFLVIPITETMLGDNKQRRKENLNNFMQLTGNVTNNPESIIKGKQLVKLACEEYGYDFDKLTEISEDSQSPDDIIDEVFNEGGTPEQAQMGWDKGQDFYNKMYQRDQVKRIPWQAKIDYNTEE